MGRKKAEEFFLNFVEAVAPGGKNRELYKATFSDMSNEEFEAMVIRIENGYILPIFFENMSDNIADVERIMEIGEGLGVEFFQHLILTDPLTDETYVTPHKYLVMALPVRRQVQHLLKKISLPDSDTKIDQLTGQPIGESKGASITLPELQVLKDKGNVRAAEELIKVRGGDKAAYLHMLNQIAEGGEWSLAPIEALGTRPQSTNTLKHLIAGINLKSTL